MRSEFTLILLILTSCMLETVTPTERGILLDEQHGSPSVKEVLQPGTHLIPFYVDFVKMEITPKDYAGKIKCLTRDFKEITVTAELRYFPIPDQVAEVYQSFGKDYFERFVKPELRANIRESIAQYDAAAIDYSEVEITTKNMLDSIYGKYHIALQDFKIESQN